MSRVRLLPFASALVLLVAATAHAQVPSGSQALPESQRATDDELRRPKDSELTARGFSLDANPSAPVSVVQVTEQRQMHGRPIYAVLVQNRANAPVKSYVVIAAVVATDGSVKATQRLEPVKNLAAGKVRKQDTMIRAATPSISDRIAFVVGEVEHATGERWRLEDTELRDAVKAVAGRR